MKKSKFFYFFFFLIFCGCDLTPYYLKYIEQGQEHLRGQNYDQAVLTYEKILNESPPQNILIRVNFQLGEIYSIYLNKAEYALNYYYTIIDIADDPLWIVKSKEKIANIHYSFLKNYQKSKKAYKTLLDFKPKLKNYNEYHFRYLDSFFKLKDYVQFKKLFSNSKKLFSKKYIKILYFKYGLSFFYQEQYKKSVEHFEIYLKYQLNSAEIITAKLIMANAYESLEDLEKAYNLYYLLKKNYPNSKVIDNKLISIFNRKIARKR